MGAEESRPKAPAGYYSDDSGDDEKIAGTRIAPPKDRPFSLIQDLACGGERMQGATPSLKRGLDGERNRESGGVPREMLCAQFCCLHLGSRQSPARSWGSSLILPDAA
jgi:hypothetical protein